MLTETRLFMPMDIDKTKNNQDCEQTFRTVGGGGFFWALFRKLRSQKNSKNSLKLSTSEARSNYCSIFLGFYYSKY